MKSPIDKWVEKFEKDDQVRIRLRTVGRWQNDPESWLIYPHAAGGPHYMCDYYKKGHKAGQTTVTIAHGVHRTKAKEAVVRHLAGMILMGFPPSYLECGENVGSGRMPVKYFNPYNQLYIFYR